MMNNAIVADALDIAVTEVRRTVGEFKSQAGMGMLPHVAPGADWEYLNASEGGSWVEDRWSHGSWTGGFAAGTCWLLHAMTGDEEFRMAAEAVTAALGGREDDRSTHDVGFLFWPSACLGHRVTGLEDYQHLASRAAESLMARQHPAGVLQSWGDLGDERARGSSAIDTMMNLPLLWWASASGNDQARRVAVAHAEFSAGAYIRSDGTTYHIVRCDDRGVLQQRGTFQGYGPETTWARGQAWAVHGFADSYRFTGDRRFLEAASTTAEAFFQRLPESGVPPWDFDAPRDVATPTDASASAIVAAGLLKLRASGLATPPGLIREAEALGQKVANHIVATHDEGAGVLRGSAYSVPHSEGVGGAVTWGDYFAVEVLLHLVDPDWAFDPVPVRTLPEGRS